MAVLNTDVANSDALGVVAHGQDRTGGAIVLPDADISPEKVLWYSLQREDQERKRSQAAARQALSELNNIRVQGWANHLTGLNDIKSTVLSKMSAYMQKTRGKSPYEFDPRNPEQAKEALEIIEGISQLKEMEAFSEQVKQWHQADVNAYKGKETNFDPESIAQNTDFYKKPLLEAYQDFASTGERPILQQAFPDWRTKAMGAAKAVGSTQQLTKREADGRIVTYGVQDVPEQENQAAFDGFLMTDHGKQALKDTNKETGLRGDALIDYVKSHYWDNFQNKKSRYEDVQSATGTAAAKKKVGVEYIPVNKLVESTGKGQENIPLEYQGKKVYYDTAGVLNPNDTKDVQFGDITELYKVVTDKNGNVTTESVSTEEKSKFRPTMSLHNSQTGASALMMVGTEGKDRDLTENELKDYFRAHPDMRKRYDEAPAGSETMQQLMSEIREAVGKESGKRTVRYIAPMDKTLQTNFNQIVDKPYTFTQKQSTTPTKSSGGTIVKGDKKQFKEGMATFDGTKWVLDK